MFATSGGSRRRRRADRSFPSQRKTWLRSVARRRTASAGANPQPRVDAPSGLSANLAGPPFRQLRDGLGRGRSVAVMGSISRPAYRVCGSRRCAYCRRNPHPPASASCCRSRGRAATRGEADVTDAREDQRQRRCRLTDTRDGEPRRWPGLYRPSARRRYRPPSKAATRAARPL